MAIETRRTPTARWIGSITIMARIVEQFGFAMMHGPGQSSSRTLVDLRYDEGNLRVVPERARVVDDHASGIPGLDRGRSCRVRTDSEHGHVEPGERPGFKGLDDERTRVAAGQRTPGRSFTRERPDPLRRDAALEEYRDHLATNGPGGATT